MRQEIEKIIDVSKTLRLTANQALFLIAVKEGIYTVDLPGEELLDLVKKGYLRGNRVTQDGFDKLDQALNDVKAVEIERVKVNSQYPILTKETGQLVKRLAKHFHRGELTPKEFDKLSAYNKNPLAIPFLFMFLQMFPTTNEKANKAWKRHFGVNASGVTLRKMSRGTARKFQAIWKKKDIGLFLLGTYMFIKESYNQESDKYYVAKIENYLGEWENWYDRAEDLLEAGELSEFTQTSSKSSSSNTVVI